MSEQIQPLLERIQTEGLQKAESEREQILADARNAAAKIVADAEKKAEMLISGAEKEAEAIVLQGKTAVSQAARDLLLQFRGELARQLNAAAEKAAAASLSSAELVTQILPEMAKNSKGKTQVEASPDLAAKLKDLLPALLKDIGVDGEVVMNPKTGAGFRLRFGDGKEAVDVSSQAVADWISHSLRPELTALLRSETPGA